MAELKVFYDTISQPSRSVLLLLGANEVKYESCVIDAMAGRVLELLQLGVLY